ncbi:MAG: alpha/beta hydrolase [Janthinobacterium lividum]
MRIRPTAPLFTWFFPWLLPLLLAGCNPAYLLNDLVREGSVVRTADIAYEPGARHSLDIYQPGPPGRSGTADSARAPLPVIVFLYGGNWRTGDKDIYKFLGRTLAQRGAVVVVPDYRLVPEVVFPGFVQDNAAAVAWAVRHAAALGGDPRSVFVMGHSAGAYNAAMLALDPSYLAAQGLERNRLAGVVALAGPFDFLPITQDDLKPVFAPVQDGPLSQPITYADGTNPPMLLLAGTADTTVQPRNTTSLTRRITERGGPVESKLYPDLGHIGILTAFTPLFAGRAPVEDDVWGFVQRHRGAGRTTGQRP